MQAKRLDELEKLYKDEQVTRKRYFNTMEDMKGKIRVYCRVRPILNFETSKGQTFALALPDELTLTHLWKEEKKPREYNFDQVGVWERGLGLSPKDVAERERDFG